MYVIKFNIVKDSSILRKKEINRFQYYCTLGRPSITKVSNLILKQICLALEGSIIREIGPSLVAGEQITSSREFAFSKCTTPPQISNRPYKNKKLASLASSLRASIIVSAHY